MKNPFLKIVLVFIGLLAFLSHSDAQVVATVSAHNTTCNLSNGSAMVTASNGTGYTYRWSAGTSTTDTISGLAAGSYTVTVYGTPVSDSTVQSFSIAPSTVPSLSISGTRSTICTVNSADTLTASGAGTAPYIWSGGTLVIPDTVNPLIVSSTNTSNYTFTVGMGGGCTATATYTVKVVAVTATLQTVTEPSCGKSNGAISISTTNSAFQNIFLKNDSVFSRNGFYQVSNAGPGNYTFILIDTASGCTDTLNNIILSDTTTYPTFNNIQVVADSCFGQSTGKIVVTLGNCASGCTFNWKPNTSDVTDSAIGLKAGIDTFYVSKGGCSNLDTIITVPGATSAVSATLTVHPDHCGKGVGSAIVIASGGTPPYSYLWSMGVPATPADSVSQLFGDTSVTVTVSDLYGCTKLDTGKIATTPKPTGVATPSDSICATDHSGVLTARGTSNDGPFTYLWSNGVSGSVDAGLGWGAYTVTITNAVGCDTVLADTVPTYLVWSHLSVSPNSLVALGTEVVVTLQTDVPVGSIVWTPYIPGSTGSTEVSFKPQQTDTFSLLLTYGQTCQIIDTFIITVYEDSTKWVIPNTFTPNGDGTNDLFHLISYPPITSFHIWIYDRWGNKIFESTDAQFGWDGAAQYGEEKPLNNGVYAYVIEYYSVATGEKKNIGGNISLVK